MKKIRVLACILAVLMVPFATLFACQPKDDKCAEGEHNFPNKWVIEQKRSCTEPEIEKRTCRDCGTVERRESKPAAGHQFDDQNKVFAHDATCTTDGHTVNECMYCNEVKIETLPGSAYGHVYLHYVATEDGYTEKAVCVRCDSVSERLLGLKLDMEGDRSHLSYQAMSVYSDTCEPKYVTEGEKTYLRIERPEGGYLGSSEFGVILSPRADVLKNASYVFEMTVKGNETTGDVNLITGEKSELNQKITFLKYNSSTYQLESIYGPVYDLTEDDFANGFTVACVFNDADMLYDIYVNNKIVAATVEYEGDYFSGIDLKHIKVTMAAGNTASYFDIDSIYLYPGDKPHGYEGGTLIGYQIYTTENGDKIMYKLPVDSEGHEHVYSKVDVVPASCHKSGYTVKTCSCGGQQITNIVAPLQHVWDDGVVVAPSCVENGYLVQTCVNCGNKKGTINAPATGHTLPADAKVTLPTCTEEGITSGNCAVCGTWFEDGSTRVPALGHEIGEPEVKKPTCTTEGYTHGKCIRCNMDYIDPSSITPAVGHYTLDFKTVAPTCTEDGYRGGTCPVCNTEIKLDVVAAYGHTLYSKVVDDKVVTKCLKCDHSEEYTFMGTAPDDKTMAEKMGSNVISSFPIDSSFAKIDCLDDPTPDPAKTSHDGIVPRNARWEVDAANNSVMVTAKSGTSSHSYWDFPARINGKSFVYQVSMRLPSISDSQEYLGITYEFLERKTTNGGANTFAPVSTDKDGNIKAGGATVGTLKTDKWTLIAIVINISNKTCDVYIDGSKAATVAIRDGFAPESIECVRMTLTNRTKEGRIDLDSLYAYYGEKPIYLGKPAEPSDLLKVDFKSNNKTVLEDNPDATAGKNYLKKFAGSDFILKDNFAPTLVVDGEGADEVRYLNIKYGTGIETATGASSGTDSHILFHGLPTSGVLNAHVKLTFNKLTGSFTVIQGRRVYRNDNKDANAQMWMVAFDNGAINVNGYGKIYNVTEGETIEIDLIDNIISKSMSVYINGVLRAENVPYNDSTYANVALTSFGYKMFNVNGGKGDIDFDVKAFNVFPNVYVPANYVGRVIDSAVENKENTIVSFDKDFNIGRLPSVAVNSDRIPGGYYYTTVSGESYLALNKNETKILQNNLGLVKVSYSGEIGVGDDVPGIWTIRNENFKTNGAVELVLKTMDGVPVNPETGNFDFTGYKSVKIRFYAGSVNNYQMKFIAEKNNPWGYRGYDFKVNTVGWQEIEIPLSAMGESRPLAWNNIEQVKFAFNGWSNGTPNCDHKIGDDGFSFYLASITLVEKDSTVTEASYELNGYPCDKHTFGEEVTVDATCTKSGCKYRECSVCGYKEVTMLDRVDHSFDPEKHTEVAATCESDGYTTDYCVNCQKTYKTVIYKTTHNYVKSDELTAEHGKAATCTEGGVDVYVCANENCNLADKEFHIATEPTGHTPKDGAEKIVVAPTCTEQGYTIIKGCANCDIDELRVDYKDALGHDIKEEIIPATCTENGCIKRSCSRCDYTMPDEVIPATGHRKPGVYLITYIDKSCKDYEGIMYKCLNENCPNEDHVVYEWNVDGGRLPHTWGEWEKISDPTCGQSGMRDKTCSVCGKKLSEDGSDEEKTLCYYPAATGNHDYEIGVYSSDNEYEVRTKYNKCKVCGHIDLSSVEEIPAKYEGTAGLKFVDNGKGFYVLNGYEGTATDIVIPSLYSGKPVIIGSAFAGKNITSIVIPKGVVISAGAFSGCTQLSSVTLPDDLTSVPARAFEGCVSLREITLPKTVSVIETGAFAGCANLEKIVINGELTSIQQFAFSGCDSLASVYYVGDQLDERVIADSGNAVLYKAVWFVIDNTQEAA